MIDAILLVILGVILLIKPGTAIDVIFKVVGIMLIAMGAVKIITFFAKKDKEERSVASLIVGILQATVGIFILIKPAVVIAIWYKAAAILIAYGAIMSLIRGIKQKNNYSGAIATLVLSAITLVLAVIVFIKPVAFASFYSQLVGISFIVEGVTLLLASIGKGQ